MMDHKQHWEKAWTARPSAQLSWHQPTPEPSLSLVRGVAGCSDPVIDVGGGASTLVEALLGAGYLDLTVLDLSRASLDALQARVGGDAAIELIEADVLDHAFNEGQFAVWHDRAAFHFFTQEADRARYCAQLALAVRPGGFAVIGTFALDGPERCSGLAVERHSPESLMDALGPRWSLMKAVTHEHFTPAGVRQPFNFVVARRGA